MSDILQETQEKVLLVTFNRIEKHNAFDDVFLAELQNILDAAEKNSGVRVIVLKANGKHFSAGADLQWMQRMASFTEEENIADAMVLAKLMYTLHKCSKPTIAMAQGSAFGGGAGLVAACDIGIAADSAKFCFSEVKLGLIPAVISPYVIRAIGPRAANALFMSAEVFDAKKALALGLVQHCVTGNELVSFTLDYAQRIASLAPQAVSEVKTLVTEVSGYPIDLELQHKTARLIAKKRVSAEGQKGLQAFLRKESVVWD
ncbi:enoyl-CoA hydratase-related protein [Legionella adelaidensis]|nr:enoyl-CoA hydratase-related protein [Legionella adelaidensis]